MLNGNESLQVGSKPRFRFTKENASMFGRKGGVTNAERIKRRKELAERTPAEKRSTSEEFIAGQIERVRSQIDKLNRKIVKTSDPRDLAHLASAMHKLCEVERVLDGRPNPGQLRPKSGGRASKMDTKTRVEPVDEVPSDTPVT